MSIRKGDVVSHSTAVEWGVGKVVEVTAQRVSVQFHDGTTRKIASSHFTSLLPADPGSYLPVAPLVPKAAPKAGAKKTASKKQAAT